MPPTRRSPSVGADVLSTREQLMAVALEFFAEHGVDGVSLAAITEAARASNASAIQYHFGSKDGLLDAIVDRYEERAQARRVELATALAERGEVTLRDEVETLVVPWAEMLGRADGVAFLRLVGQLLTHPRFSIVDRHRKALASASQGLLGGLRRAEERNPARWTARWILVTGLIFHGLADYAQMRTS